MELVKSKIEEAKDKAKESGIDATGGAGAAWTGLQQWIKSTVPEDAQDKVCRVRLARAESLRLLICVNCTFLDPRPLGACERRARQWRRCAEARQRDV